MTELRILLADDHPIVRNGLRGLLDAEPDMAVVGDVADGEAAVHAAAELLPDVVVMDVSMPCATGEEATSHIRRDCPGVRVLAITAYEDRRYLRRLLAAGAAGYVLKRSAPAELVRAVRCVAAGQTYLDPAVAEHVVEELTRVPTVELSDRETEVLRLVARGHLLKRIAAELGVEHRTVETYKARAMEKLGLKTRVDVVRYAADRGWLGGS